MSEKIRPEIPGSWLPFQTRGPEQMHNPKGTEFLDSAALLSEQQQRLNERKAGGRKENENYLLGHPEVQLTLNLFVQDVLEQRPKNIMKHAVNFFTNGDLDKIIEDLLRKQREEDSLRRRAARMGPQFRRRQREFGAWKSLRYLDSRDELGISKDGFYGREDGDADGGDGSDGEDGKDGRRRRRRRRKSGEDDDDDGKGGRGQGAFSTEQLDPFRDCLPSCRETCRIAGGHIPVSRMLSFEAPIQGDDDFVLDEFKTDVDEQLGVAKEGEEGKEEDRTWDRSKANEEGDGGGEGVEAADEIEEEEREEGVEETTGGGEAAMEDASPKGVEVEREGDGADDETKEDRGMEETANDEEIPKNTEEEEEDREKVGEEASVKRVGSTEVPKEEETEADEVKEKEKEEGRIGEEKAEEKAEETAEERGEEKEEDGGGAEGEKEEIDGSGIERKTSTRDDEG